MTALDLEVQLASYFNFVNKTQVLMMHNFLVPIVVALVGQNFTEFAAGVIFEQCKLFLDGRYDCVKTDLWTGMWKIEVHEASLR